MKSSEYEYSDVVETLEQSGLEKGDVVYSHSNLGYFGRPDGVTSKVGVCDLWQRAFLSVLGESGTLVVPTFSYSFGSDQETRLFDVRQTPGVGGMFPEFVRTNSPSTRSLDPMFSVSAIGARQEDLTRDVGDVVFGEESIWARLLDHNAMIVNLNIDITSTFIHFAEYRSAVPYRKDRTFQGTVIDQEGNARGAVSIFNCRDLSDPNNRTRCHAINEIAHAEGLARTLRLGKGTLCTIRSKDYFDLVARLVAEDPYFLTRE